MYRSHTWATGVKVHTFGGKPFSCPVLTQDEAMKKAGSFGLSNALALFCCSGSGSAVHGEYQLVACDYRTLGAPYSPVLACSILDKRGDQVSRFTVKF